MEIFKLEETLPNGFHDTFLHSLSYDLLTRTARFSLEISVGLPESEDPDAYRTGELLLKGVRYVIIDPPDGSEPAYQWRGETRIELGAASPKVTERLGVNDGAFAASFYVSDINACIHFEATEAEIVWDQRDRAHAL
jgi:hypothetical protein